MKRRVDASSDDDTDMDEYFKKGSGTSLNAHGSNYITYEDLINGGKNINSFGWESDVDTRSQASTPGPMEENDEEKDERERKEFMDAIRLARGGVAASTSNESNNEKGYDGLDSGDVYDDYEDTETLGKSALQTLEAHNKGKELKPVDHSKIEYPKFRKNLYIEAKALHELTPEAVQEIRDDLEIKVAPIKGTPVPIDNWDQSGLSDRILELLRRYNLLTPFAIQKQALPAIMCGRDIIGIAKTGSGKTLAFLLPIFRHVLDQPPLQPHDGPIALIMAPARELAFQIFTEAKKFAKLLGLRVACIYGGAGVAEQIAELKRGAEIVVCTPGRMIDILCMQAGKIITLKRVTIVVMDEADRMFDMGFEPQIKMIMQNIRPDRQTVLFSATFPTTIESIAKSMLKYPVQITVGDGQGRVNKDITQIIEVHDEGDKFLRLLQLLGLYYEAGNILIFVDKQEKCDQLFQELLKSGYPCLSLHGGKDQLDRDHTLHEFKTLVKTVLVATSVAGRGLDVPEIVLVINYNCPNHLEDYVHRVGRTGRAGRKGTAYTFISESEDQYASIMLKALKRADQIPPRELVELNEKYYEKVRHHEKDKIKFDFRKGKGFTFDAEEMNQSQRNASMQRKAFELEQGILPVDPAELADGEEEDEDEDEDEDDVVVTASSSNKATKYEIVAAADKALKMLPSTSSSLEKSRAIANTICSLKGLPSALSLNEVKVNMTIDARAALAKAKQIVKDMTASKEGEASQSGRFYTEELDINDYPPLARKKVTSKSGIAETIERHGIHIINRGKHVEKGKKPTDEGRLRIIIEGGSELSVKQSKAEIIRILEEETVKSIGGAAPAAGRYSVL